MNPKRKEYDGYDEANSDSRLVDKDFLEKQSLSSKTTRFDIARKASNDDVYREEAANDALYEEQAQEAIMEEEEQENARRSAFVRQKAIQQRRQTLTGVAGKVKGIGSFARWMAIDVAVVAYALQLIFALFSLVGFGAGGIVKSFLEDTTLGKILNKTVGLFVDLEKVFPVENLGYAFWALATLIAVSTFIGFLLWFYITGVRFFNTTISSLITILVFAFSILPVSNLFPAILFWVLYVNLTSTISSVKALAKT
jgi:hypothetical protein